MRRLLLFAILFLSPSLITAQVVRGKLTVAGGTPVAGAIVTLVDSSGTVIGRVLSTPLGGYALSTGLPGDYSLRVLRVGFPAWKSRPFALRPGAPTDFSAELPEDAIVLTEINVSSNGASCQVVAEDGSATATLLEEVGKALGSAELALNSREYAFQMVRSVMLTSQTGMRVSHDSLVQLLYVWPLTTLPATRLRDGGFVQRKSVAGLGLLAEGGDDGYVWFGPDAATLLATPFLESHCFRVAEDRQDSTRIGLSFAPARGRSRSDISGTLWLDRGTLALHHLEYDYVNVPTSFPRKGSQGEMQFIRLPNGMWLISRWMIRAPRELTSGGRTVGIAGWSEEVGYIREVRTLDGELVYLAPARGR